MTLRTDGNKAPQDQFRDGIRAWTRKKVGIWPADRVRYPIFDPFLDDLFVLIMRRPVVSCGGIFGEWKDTKRIHTRGPRVISLREPT